MTQHSSRHSSIEFPNRCILMNFGGVVTPDEAKIEEQKNANILNELQLKRYN